MSDSPKIAVLTDENVDFVTYHIADFFEVSPSHIEGLVRGLLNDIAGPPSGVEAAAAYLRDQCDLGGEHSLNIARGLLEELNRSAQPGG